MSDQQDTVLEVEGMTCQSCVRHVTSALTDIDGVQIVNVRLRDGLVTVKHDATQATIPQLVAALDEAGYASKPRQQ